MLISQPFSVIEVTGFERAKVCMFLHSSHVGKHWYKAIFAALAVISVLPQIHFLAHESV